MSHNALGQVTILIGAALLLTGCPCDTTRDLAILTPIDGVIGFDVEGDWNFVGTLIFDDSEGAAWDLEGSFTFPTPGYLITKMEVTVAESFPEQVSIVIKVLPPPPGTVLPQVLDEVPIALTVPQVSDEATFNIWIETKCWGL